MPRYCTNCGTENKEKSIFCRRCGEKLFRKGTGNTNDSSKKGISKKILISLIILLIVTAIVGAYVFVTLSNNYNPYKPVDISSNVLNNSSTIQTEKVYISSSSQHEEGTQKVSMITPSENFIITMTMDYKHNNFKIHEDPFIGYLTIKPKSDDIKIISIEVKEGNGFDGFYWKTYKINSKGETTITLGENTLANVYENGDLEQITYIIHYEKN